MKSYKNKHKDKDIWILGSGKSLDYVSDSFFENKTTIGVNLTYKRYNLTYNIWHHHEHERIKESLKKSIVFVSEYYNCMNKGGKFKNADLLKKIVTYKHNEQSFANLDSRPLFTDTEEILTGGTTVINAVGLAVHMGAKNIILCGCDNGSIEGKPNYKGYYTTKVLDQKGHSLTSYKLMILVREELKKININMYSLNPFLDFNLDGLKYDQTTPGDQKYRDGFNVRLFKAK